MRAALINSVDGSVLARWEDLSATEFPVPPENCSYSQVSDSEFDLLSNIFRADGHLAWKLQGGQLSPRSTARPFILICNKTSRAVVALDRAIPSFLPPSVEAVSVSQDDYGMVSDSMSHDAESFIPAWDCSSDGTVTARQDVRPVLRISFSGNAVVGQPFSINFQVEDDQGNPLNFTGQRPLKIYLNGEEREVDLALTNGQATVIRTFTNAGTIRIASAQPSSYRVAGNLSLSVVESW